MSNEQKKAQIKALELALKVSQLEKKQAGLEATTALKLAVSARRDAADARHSVVLSTSAAANAESSRKEADAFSLQAGFYADAAGAAQVRSFFFLIMPLSYLFYSFFLSRTKAKVEQIARSSHKTLTKVSTIKIEAVKKSRLEKERAIASGIYEIEKKYKIDMHDHRAKGECELKALDDELRALCKEREELLRLSSPGASGAERSSSPGAERCSPEASGAERCLTQTSPVDEECVFIEGE